MKAYQAGIAKFTESKATVFGVSTDDEGTNARFAESLGLEFALLSDHTGKVAKQYGVYLAEHHIASRTTFVVDKNGKIEHIDSGQDAIDIAGAANACSRLKK